MTEIIDVEVLGENDLDVSPDSNIEFDPTVPAWAKEPTKPSYSAGEVGALPESHNSSPDAHGDIRDAVSSLQGTVEQLIESGELTQEIEEELRSLIGDNHRLIDRLSSDKVGVSDIINNLVTCNPSKPLSAEQGTVIKSLIDSIIVPTKVSQLENDSEYAEKDYVDTAISGIQVPDVETLIANHNVSTASHSDIRILIDGLSSRLNAVADSDDITLDQLSEIVSYIKSNRSLIDSITTGKVSVADIVDNLTTNVASKPLSAAQGVVIGELIEQLQNERLQTARGIDDAAVSGYYRVSGDNFTIALVDGSSEKLVPDTVVWVRININYPKRILGITNSGLTWYVGDASSGNMRRYCLTPDANPTSGSSNTITSDAVYKMWQEIEGEIEEITSHDASGQIAIHNASDSSHSDIRTLISTISLRLNAIADSDDTTLDQLSEIVTCIKSNRSLIDNITTGKVSVSDIIDNLTTCSSGKPLSAAQGVVIKTLIDSIVVPTKTSDLQNDSGYLTSHQDISGLQSKNISDAGGYYTSETVEAALQEIGAELSGINTLLGSGVIE